MATPATTEGECPSATRSRERATRCLTPTPARVFPRSPTHRSCGRAPAPARRPCGAAPARLGAPPCRRAPPARPRAASHEFSRDLQLIGLAAERPLQLGDLAAQLPLALALLLAGERLPPALEQLLTPAVVERLRDRMLAADLLHRAVAAQPGQHDLDLLLRRPAPVLALLAQPLLLVGREAPW